MLKRYFIGLYSLRASFSALSLWENALDVPVCLVTSAGTFALDCSTLGDL